MKRNRDYHSLGTVGRVRASRPSHAPPPLPRRKAGSAATTAPGRVHAVIPGIDGLPGRAPAPEAITNPHRFLATPASRRQASFKVERAADMLGGTPELDLGDDLFSRVAREINLGLRIVVTSETEGGTVPRGGGGEEIVDKRGQAACKKTKTASREGQEKVQIARTGGERKAQVANPESNKKAQPAGPKSEKTGQALRPSAQGRAQGSSIENEEAEQEASSNGEE